MRRKYGKYHLPNPGLEHRLVFKRGAVEAIQRVKGWQNLTEMADALGITRQYMSMLHKTRVAVTHTVITRLAVLLGNIRENWWIHYEIVPYGVKDENHPVWNSEKEMGRMPYDKYSSSAELRKKDYIVEEKKI